MNLGPQRPQLSPLRNGFPGSGGLLPQLSKRPAQRAGFVISRQSDQVEVTQTALQALGDESQLVHIRGAAVFVQMKDLLATCQQKVTGYATFAPRKPSRPNLD